MGKIAYIFPGQGSQFVGMGKDIYDNFKSAAMIFEEASDRLHIDIRRLAFDGPEEELNRTSITQPVVFTLSAAILSALKDSGVGSDPPPSYTAGHSLGEYTSLYFGGSFSFGNGLSLVGKRGEIMEGAVREGEGAMAAILGLERGEVDKLVAEISTGAAVSGNEKGGEGGVVVSANYNAPGQVVISGHRGSVERAAEAAVESGAKKAVLLKVSVPSHSPLMKAASEEFSEHLEATEVGDAGIPVISNVTALPFPEGDGGEGVKRLLVEQLISPVRWEEAVRHMIDNDVTDFIEIGPGRVLSGLVKRIDRKVTVVSVGDIDSLKNVEKKYQ